MRAFEGFRSRVGAEGVVETTKGLGTDGSFRVGFGVSGLGFRV